MSDLAPSPSSSLSGHDHESDQSDSSNAPPPQGSRSGSSSSRNGSSSSGGPKSTSPSSNSQGSSSSSPPPQSRSSSSPPQPSPSRSSWNGGSSKSSPPPTPSSDSPRNNDDDDDSNSSPPPTRSGSPSSPPPPSPSSSPSTPSGRSPPSSGESPPRSSPPPPQWSSNNGQSGSPSVGGQSSPPPPAPTNHSVVFIPIVSSNSPPGALPPPGLVAISPAGAVGVMSTHLPGSMPAHGGTTGSMGMQAGSSGSVSSGGGGSTSSTQHSSVDSSRAVSGQVAAAIAGAAVAGFLFAMVAIFFVVSRRRKKTDGLVYHQDGSYYMHSGQLVGSNHPSGVLYPAPPGASGGFSYGPPAAAGPGMTTDSLRGGGYYQSGSMEPPGSKSSFSYEELTSITSNFSRNNVIGEGGFGCVYKGWLADGKCVAVKQLKAGSGQGEREFQAEVEIISRVHHRHLVSLVGYCVAQHHRMLIYEFVPNGTLEHHLHDRGVSVMDWATRLRIAIGAAKGLAYLHEDCHPRIIHRDIKSANILLDYSFEAQVADFGLAKLSNDTHTHVSTRVMGTFGYLAPEYASSGKLTDRSDVFSFGVVLLELITGRKPVDQTRPLGDESLVEWARPVLAGAVETGDLGELVDPRLEGAYNKAEVARMVEAAAACVRHSAPKRPRMVQVMRALDVDEGSMSDLSNGVKVGQSQAYRTDQQEAALEQLRRTAFASEEFTGEFGQSVEHGNGSETRPMNQ